MIFRTNLLLVLSVLLTIPSCSSRTKELEADYPFDRIAIYSREILFVASSGVKLENLVSVKCFQDAGLWPGISADEAIAIMGRSPQRIFLENAQRDAVYGFTTECGELQIVKQKVSSEGIDSERWFLRLRPFGHSRDLVAAEILKILEENEIEVPRLRLIDGTVDSRAASLYFEGSELKYLWWLS